MAEEEYFKRIDEEKKAKLAEEHRERKKAAELVARKKAHWLKCGKCGADMETRVWKGIEVEVCPECNAVLLDPGELETLTGVDRSSFFNTLGELFGVKKGTKKAGS
jgi:uncharacterized protein